MKNTPKISAFAHILMVLALGIGYLAPLPVEAQIYYSSTISYEQNPSNGAIYLLPNRGLPGEGVRDPRILVASALSISCAPTRLFATTREPITWFSSVTGGSGSYLYTWNGTEGLSGNTSTVSKTYNTNGEKFATLTVTSGNKVMTVSCGFAVVEPGTSQPVTLPSFGASCYATPGNAMPGESVTWLSVISGTTASTTYAWDGTDGLSGDRPLVSTTYGTNGTKFALLTVTNGTSRIVTSCTNAVSVGVRIAVASAPKTTTTSPSTDIHAVCVPSSTNLRTREEVLWTVTSTGGNGNYEYLWSGDDALIGTSASTSKQYETAGVKNASVIVTSGAKTATITCPSVEVTKSWSGLVASSLFSWVNGTVGYILAILLAIFAGILFARRKHAKEVEEEEKDHVQ